MRKGTQDNRPLSPFMFGTLYRWQISSVTSALHRITGVALFFSYVLIVFWLIAMATDGWFQTMMQWIVSSWLGKIIFFFSLLGMWYHFLNGIRHLVWDAGFGFGLDTAAKSGMAVIGLSAVMTLITIILV